MKLKGKICSIVGGVILAIGFAMSQTAEYKHGLDKDARPAVVFLLGLGIVLLAIGGFRLFTSYKAQQNKNSSPSDSEKE
ncbi:MAG: hypothetical protein FWG31_09895 [Oscillospiraceae bacterium]|nr:hypothetical protein [Oscillospiraceae bacterium]